MPHLTIIWKFKKKRTILRFAKLRRRLFNWPFSGCLRRKSSGAPVTPLICTAHSAETPEFYDVIEQHNYTEAFFYSTSNTRLFQHQCLQIRGLHSARTQGVRVVSDRYIPIEMR